ncbi:MAG TPA: alpha/beta fold hydrolase [Actinocrinis sp.]|nr:alpha/beta fold hydrolase [Actinocrinis sp.]
MTVPPMDASLWMRRFHPAPAGAPRLVCFPHAGGSASFYYPVSQALAGKVDVLAIQYPGRQDRRSEPSPDSVDALVDGLYPALKTVLGGPTAFFGHSMGAILAFEVSRRLAEHDGFSPSVLFASGRRAPSSTRDENVHELDDAGVVREMQQLSGTDARLLADEEVLRMIMPAIRTDYKAIETYRCAPGVTVDAPVLVLTGDEDPKTTLAEARAWQGHTTGAFDLKVYPGGHFFLVQQAGAVIDTVRDRLLGAGVRG